MVGYINLMKLCLNDRVVSGLGCLDLIHKDIVLQEANAELGGLAAIAAADQAVGLRGRLDNSAHSPHG